MNAQDLIEILTSLPDPENTEVRMAIQPNWPFEHAIAGTVFNHETDQEEYCDEPDRDDYHTTEEYLEAMHTYEGEHPERDPRNQAPVIYLTDGNQIGYLPGNIASAAGW